MLRPSWPTQGERPLSIPLERKIAIANEPAGSILQWRSGPIRKSWLRRLQTAPLRVSFWNMEDGPATEAKIIAKLFALLKGSGKFKKVIKGESIKGKGIGEVLGWNEADVPWAMTVPDLILASSNFSKTPDDVFLLAIESKYFPRDAASNKPHWRQSFREIGQPLRDLLYGYDAAVLWHLFSEAVDDEHVGKYTDMCAQVIEKLKLPIVYFATKLTEQDQFAFFKPWRPEKTLLLSDVNYVAECLRQVNIERNGSYRAKINPLLQDKTVMAMRGAVKSVLRIP